MKKLLSFLSLTIFCSMVFAQTVTLTFTGRDTNKLYVQLSRIDIENATQNWQLTINYPDTVLELGQVGIENYEAENGFVLLQNNPNPFESTTYSILNTVESGEVVLTLTDMNGRTISMQHFVSLQPGKHQFRINVANTGTYLLTALQNGKTSSVKMVNNGNAAENKIEYVGIAEQEIARSLPVKSIMDATANPFNKGDEMVYTGYATVNGTEYQSQTIRQKQNESEDIVLLFQRLYDGLPCLNHPTVTDHEGNVYNTVQIGTQCWTKENLRTTTSPTTGTYLVNNDTATSKNSSITGKQAYWYMHDSLTYAPMNYGLFYNWNAAVDTFNVDYSDDELSINRDIENVFSVTFTGKRRGICPEGWHLPTDTEWIQLTDYILSIEEYRSEGCECKPDKKYIYCIVKALASTTGWERLADTEQNKEYSDFLPGKNPADNNATGFTAFPAGCYNGRYGDFAFLDNFTLVGRATSFQSATEQNLYYGGALLMDYDMYHVAHSGLFKDSACSVRCLRD